MTRLQTELLDAIKKVGPNTTPFGYVTACEEVAKRYIEKALRDGTKEVFSDNSGNLMPTVQNVYVKRMVI